MIAGVAGGIARHYGYDPTIVRLAIAAIGIVTFGAVFVGYGVAWIVMPRDDGQLIADNLQDNMYRNVARHGRGSMWIGIALFCAGLIALFDNNDWWPSDFVGPIVLITIGCALLFSGRQSPGRADDQLPSGSPNTPSGSPPASAPRPPTVSAHPEGSWPGSQHDYVRRQRRVHHEAAHQRRMDRRNVRRDSYLGRLILSAIALLVGGAWLVDATNATNVNPGFVGAMALTLLGLGLIVGSWFGYARRLVWLAIPLTAGLALASSLSIPWDKGAGERTYRPISTADVQAKYELGFGQLNVDLTQVDGTEPLTVRARLGMGELQVIVPDDANVTVDARVGAGQIRRFGRTDDGGLHQHFTFTSKGTGRTIMLTLHNTLGEVRVVRESSPDQLDTSDSTITVGDTR